MFWLNVAFRGLVILVGFLVLFSVEPFVGLDSPLHEIFGIVVMLFGTYRIFTFIVAGKKSG